MAKEKFVQLPGGKELTFPATMSDAEIRARVLDEILGPIPEFEIPPEVKKQADFLVGLAKASRLLGDYPKPLVILLPPLANAEKPPLKQVNLSMSFSA